MERRRFPRIEVEIPATINLPSGIQVPVRIRDLSSAGLQIQCDAIDSERIAPDGNHLRQGQPVEASVAFNLVQDNFCLDCRLVFVRRASQDLYVIGLRYTDPLQDDLIRLIRLLPKL